MADSGYKSVSRIDIPHRKTHGWQVRVWFKGKMYNKFFNDNHYVSREEALQAAVEHRNEIERKLGKPRSEHAVVTQPPRKRAGGTVGVRRIMKQTGAYTKDGYPIYRPVYEATWCINHKVGRTTYSIDKHGEAEAFRLAYEARKRHLPEYYQQSSTADDEKPGD